MDKHQFLDLAKQGYNKIPLMRSIPADLDTPLSAFLKLAAKPNTYLFESVQGGEKWGRYSIIGLPASSRIEVSGYRVAIRRQGKIIQSLEVADPLAWIEKKYQSYQIAPVANAPAFTGGLVGYFGYDTIAYIEPKLASTKPDPLNTPDIILMISDVVVVFDNLKGLLYCLVLVDANIAAYERGQKHLASLSKQLRVPCPHYQPIDEIDEKAIAIEEQDFSSTFSPAEYEKAVGQIKSYIHAGDVMQVVLSRRLSIPVKTSALAIYRVLRRLNPSPYLFYIDLGDFQIIGSSPETLTRVENNTITVRPIAGTRPRGHDAQTDQALETELLNDPKECAEHLMLIDLGRNDVGRVSKTGTVRLTEKMSVERYSHVMHIVSNVTGELDKSHSLIDVLRATFPAGTVSGAPKIRAMEIIDELEPIKRGIYSGAVGYLSWNGNMDTTICLRTAIVKHQVLYTQSGGGIVADSMPNKEWEETLNKARAILRSVALAESAFQTPVTDHDVND